MTIMTSRNAKKRFGELRDSVRREPVVVTRNNRAVGIMTSIEDAADTVFPQPQLDKERGYDVWLFDKVSTTLARVDADDTKLHTHDDALALLRERIEARVRSKD